MKMLTKTFCGLALFALAASSWAVPVGCDAGVDYKKTFSTTVLGKKHTCKLNGRDYILYVPKTHNKTNIPVPLIVSLHGAAETNSSHFNYTKYPEALGTKDVMVAYPQGLSTNTDGKPHWNDGRKVDGTSTDVYGPAIDDQFIANMMATINADPAYLVSDKYIAGMSNGGIMTMYMICNSFSFKGAAVVAASAYKKLAESCTNITTPVVFIYGRDDKVMGAYPGEKASLLLGNLDATKNGGPIADINLGQGQKNENTLVSKTTTEMFCSGGLTFGNTGTSVGSTLYPIYKKTACGGRSVWYDVVKGEHVGIWNNKGGVDITAEILKFWGI